MLVKKVNIKLDFGIRDLEGKNVVWSSLVSESDNDQTISGILCKHDGIVKVKKHKFMQYWNARLHGEPGTKVGLKYFVSYATFHSLPGVVPSEFQYHISSLYCL